MAKRLDELAAELVQLKVDVIVALQMPAALAAQRATREIRSSSSPSSFVPAVAAIEG